MKQFVFVSSVQKELAYERAAVRDFIRGDPLLGQYFDVFLFEDLPAGDAAPATRYLAEVDRAAVSQGIFGNDYGWERLWRDWLTDDVLAGLGLNPRQSQALGLLRQQRRITTAEFQRVTAASRATAKRDLEDLVAKGLLLPAGAGRGAFYRLGPKRLISGSNGPRDATENGS